VTELVNSVFTTPCGVDRLQRSFLICLSAISHPKPRLWAALCCDRPTEVGTTSWSRPARTPQSSYSVLI